MKLLKQLKDLILSTNMSFEEVRAFELGMARLSLEDQVALYRVLSQNPDLIYPTYINYKAKMIAKKTGVGWEAAVESELAELERYIEKKRVGEEVRIID
jgi:hypothetical protein